MKFEDKLIELRKKEGLSQEQLAEKLNVTRQTISKWELGDSKPSMDKLIEISKIFNVDINELTLNNATVSKNTKNDNNSKRKIVLVICIVLLILSVGTLGYRVLSSRKEKNNGIFDSFFSIFDKATDIIDNNINNMGDINSKFDDKNKKIDVLVFNNKFEPHAGNVSDFFLESVVADLIINNKKNKDYLIEFIYNGESYGTDTDKISEFKDTLDTRSVIDRYDLSFDYDDDGYINKFIVKKLKK